MTTNVLMSGNKTTTYYANVNVNVLYLDILELFMNIPVVYFVIKKRQVKWNKNQLLKFES